MRIAIDGTAAIKQLGGVSEYARQIIGHLSNVDQENHYHIATASLFRGSTLPLPHLSSRMHEHRVSLPAKLLEASWYSSGWPPLTAFTGPVDVAFYPRPLVTRTKVPAVATVHDLSWLIMPGLAEDHDRTRYEVAVRRAVTLAEHIITISEASKRDLLRIFRIPESKVSITYLGYDESLTEPASKHDMDQFRRQFSLGETPYFLHVGTLEPRKNIVRLVEAFTLFKYKTGAPHKLVLVGRPGWLYQDILDAIDKSASKADIVMTGSVNASSKRAAYHGAFVVVFPSLYEGFGIPILEAQVSGCPVICGNGGSLEEVGADSVLRSRVEDVDDLTHGLERVADDAGLREDLIKRGLENIKRFSWDQTARQTKDILEKAGRS